MITQVEPLGTSLVLIHDKNYWKSKDNPDTVYYFRKFSRADKCLTSQRFDTRDNAMDAWQENEIRWQVE